MYPFGMKVRVEAFLIPVYITWVDEVSVRAPASKPVTGKNISFNYKIVKKPLPQQEMRQVDPGGYKSKVKGEALPGSHPVPQDGNKHRRLRRIKTSKIGVVVGWTWRSEGRFHPDDINFLAENRRQWGHEVALDHYQGTKHAWTTSVVFCLVDDLDPFGL